MIEAKDITKVFPGTIANDHVCLKVKPGEIMGLVGENGAGKSTILKCLNGVYPTGSYEGTIYVQGKEVYLKRPLDAMHAGIGYVPQEINILGDMNVAENIYLFDLKNGGKNKLVNHRELFERTKKLLEDNEINLDPEANTRQLSVGQQQMLMIARALASDPKILILDEPTNGLDPSGIHEIHNLVKSLPSLYDCTVLISSHMLSEIELIADDIGILNHGRLLFEGSMNDLRQYALQSSFAADNLEDVFLSMVEKDNMDRKQRAKL